jgi:RNA polymerase sigma factor (TIGR02999 family)
MESQDANPESSDVPADASAEAMTQLFSQVYGELRAIAQKQMNNERPDHTLRATELVHEAYMRLLGNGLAGARLHNRAQFFHAAGEAMRRILIEHARKRARIKRGGGREHIELSLVDAAIPENPQDMLALDDAFRRLEEKDPRAAEVVRLRFFAGLTVDQIADALNLSSRTIKREWEFARAWLAQSLG